MAVARRFDEGGVLLAEAGTGTGKTLAYLVPAILSRQRVLVSTGTKNLQEQIYFKDIPALRATLGVPFTAACMKGRANYLCLHRLDAARERVAAAGNSWTRARRRVPADHPRVVGANRDRRPRRARGPARGRAVLERRVRDRRDLPRHRVPALRRVLRHAHAPARRGVRRRHRQSPPALRRCRRPPERVRRSDPGLCQRDRRRGASARGRRDAVFRLLASATTGSKTRPRRRASCSGEPCRTQVANRTTSRARSRTSEHRARVLRGAGAAHRAPGRPRGEERVRATASSLAPARDAAAS